MRGAFAYDRTVEPPAPVLPVRISAPAPSPGEEAVLVPMLVDTGADCTLVPARLVRLLKLPLVDRLSLTGVGGATRRAPVHAAAIEVAGARMTVRVVAFHDEGILGRDVLNRAVVTLDGPGLTLSFKPPRR